MALLAACCVAGGPAGSSAMVSAMRSIRSKTCPSNLCSDKEVQQSRMVAPQHSLPCTQMPTTPGLQGQRCAQLVSTFGSGGMCASATCSPALHLT